MPINIGQGINFGGGISIITPSQTNIPVQSGLVMQLDATNPLSYSGTGTTVTDLTGGYNHTLTDANMFVDSGGIKYFQFDAGGTSKKMNVIGTGPTLNTGGYTYMFWSWLESSNGIGGNPSSNRFLASGTGGGGNNPRFGMNNSNQQYMTISNIGTFNSLGGNYLSVGQIDAWVQLTFTVSSSDQVECTVNNVATGSQNLSSYRGHTHVGFGNYANWGRVAICCLYNRVLSNAEVSTNYNGLKGFFGL